MLVDARAELAELLGVRGVPTNVLVDEDGTIVAVGAPAPEDLEAAVVGLLGRPLPEDEPPAGRGANSPGYWGQDVEHIKRHLLPSERGGPAEASGEPGTGTCAPGTGSLSAGAAFE